MHVYQVLYSYLEGKSKNVFDFVYNFYKCSLEVPKSQKNNKKIPTQLCEMWQGYLGCPNSLLQQTGTGFENSSFIPFQFQLPFKTLQTTLHLLLDSFFWNSKNYGFWLYPQHGGNRILENQVGTFFVNSFFIQCQFWLRIIKLQTNLRLLFS